MVRWIAVLLGLLFVALPAQAQRAIAGSVADAESGEVLPGANIALLGPDGAVVGGTSTNRDGQFTLRVPTLPATVAVRFIGYESQRLQITATTPSPVAIRLRPTVGELGGVTVTPGEAPAVALMRRVIAKTRAQRAAVGPYAVTAYGRSTIFAPDGAIKGVVEGLSDAYWSKDSGWREVYQAGRRTENLGGGMNSATAVADGMIDLLASDIEIAGHRLVGPTHPDAIDVYQFEILSNEFMDGRPVATVALRPKRATASAFVGTLKVFFDSADVLEADVEPGASFVFPPPIRLEGARFRQQYVPVAADSSLWLPADLRSVVGVGFGVDFLLSSEPFKIERVVQLSGYRLGAVAPDSLLTGPTVRRAPRPDSTRLATPGVAPALTADETRAYAAGDSLGKVEEVLVFTGPLAGLARRSIRVSNRNAERDSTAARTVAFGLAPRIQVNQGEGLRVGGGVNVGVGPARVAPYALFRTADSGVTLGADASVRLAKLGEDGSLAVTGSVFDGVARNVVPDAPALAGGLLAGPGGYYASRSISGGLQVEIDDLGTLRQGSFIQTSVAAKASVRYISEEASRYRDCELCSDLLRFAPGDSLQTARSVRFDGEFGTLGTPFGLMPTKKVRTMFEWSPSTNTRPSFWRADAALDWQLSTFARRRALPPALDVRLAAGVSGGDVPGFRQFGLEGSFGDFGFGATAFGTLRTLQSGSFAGDRYALVAWEHSFRTIPFELLGLESLTKRSYNLILHGAHAQVWTGDANLSQRHHEVGVSLSGILGGLRLDVTQRLDRSATVFGIGIARVF